MNCIRVRGGGGRFNYMLHGKVSDALTSGSGQPMP